MVKCKAHLSIQSVVFYLLQEQRWELQIARNFLLNKEQHYIGLKTDLGSTTYPSLSHACVRAFQQQFYFFAVTSVTISF